MTRLIITDFLGRTVLLEQPTSAGAKVISHMLVSHGGRIL